jgi:very-short-patch-repair endonuclease
LSELLDVQQGVVTRGQAISAGLSRHAIAARVETGRWQRLHRGVFVTFSGPIPRTSQLWGAVLRAGDDAVLSHHTAAELWGLSDAPSASIHATVPRQAGPLVIAGLALHYSARIPVARHPARLPPQAKLEETVLDLANISTSAEDAVGWPIKACQRRLTTPTRIAGALEERTRMRWRSDVADAIAVHRIGVHSPLELRYFRDVERKHGLLRGDRQVLVARGVARQYLDLRYTGYGVVVELDGVLAHSPENKNRDARRDNANTLNGYQTLRYGWAAVAYHACETAIEVFTLLRRNGYPGALRPCGKACPVSALKVWPVIGGQTFSANDALRITARSAERGGSGKGAGLGVRRRGGWGRRRGRGGSRRRAGRPGWRGPRRWGGRGAAG